MSTLLIILMHVNVCTRMYNVCMYVPVYYAVVRIFLEYSFYEYFVVSV